MRLGVVSTFALEAIESTPGPPALAANPRNRIDQALADLGDRLARGQRCLGLTQLGDDLLGRVTLSFARTH